MSGGWWAAMVLGLALLLGAAGCKPTVNEFQPPVVSLAGVSQQGLPGYRDLVEGYNRDLDRLDPLFAQTVVEVKWIERDDAGQANPRRESGSGKLILDGPDRTVFTVEKLGKIYLWAGSDADRFWLFDLAEQPRAVVGKRGVDGLVESDALPLGIDPARLPYLLGLAPLDPEASGTVMRTRRGYTIEPPGLGVRLFLDRKTGKPTRAELLDSAGQLRVVSEMKHTVGVARPGVRRSTWPEIPLRTTVWAVGEEARLEIKIREAVSDPAGIQSRWFDFGFLMQALNVLAQDVRVVE